MTPSKIKCVIPSRLQVGEEFDIRVKVTGTLRPIPSVGQWDTMNPELHGQFNLNPQRDIQYHDNCLPEWAGRIIVDGDVDGAAEIDFDGVNQGVFPDDTRPIRAVHGFSFTTPGFHFIRLVDVETGLECSSNPVFVTTDAPVERIYWGDPHWQTFFSDGIRCPEELYAFARDEGFLDFGAITDHMEAVTDRQWDYFQAVTNDYNEPGRFVTLIGQEWTAHAPGHRNLYFRGDYAPAIRSTDPRYDTLEKLWKAFDELADLDPIAIPHHPANVMMGVDWELGWNPKYEKAVEIISVWGSSEKPATAGNTMPIQHCGGEAGCGIPVATFGRQHVPAGTCESSPGHHVVDALRMGYRMGFVGGGDIHDGRPGDPFHNESYPPSLDRTWPEGFTAVMVPELTRSAVFDAIKDNRTYASTQSRIYLDVGIQGGHVAINAASEERVRECVILVNGEIAMTIHPDDDPRIVTRKVDVPVEPGDFVYVRVLTNQGNLAWSSPVFL